MKNFIPLAILMMLFVGTAKGDVTKTVGATGANYATLKAAFDAINAGTVRTGVITLQIVAGTTETASAVLYASGSGNSSYTSVIIYPTLANLSIAGNFSASTIDLQGADNVTIDGRVNLAGSSPSLEISNINSGTFSSAIRFILSAESNTVRYCNLKSSCYSAGVGMINFTSSASGNGNDNNIIEYCNITNAGTRPFNAIFSSGTAGRENSGNIIRNNNIYNFFNATSNSYGINISNSSTDWTISDNSFYETSSFAPAGAFKYYPLFINTGNNNVISNNFIGGTEPLCAGTAWIINSNVTHYFCGIYVNGGTAGTLQNNTIRNINYTSVEDNPWDGIYINDGNVNVTGNTIGATTGNSSIIITTPLPAATTTVTGGVVNNSITIVGGGSGYTVAPLISFSAPPTGGTSPTATATVSGGAVTAINVTYGGSGYVTAPNVYFDGQSNNYSTSHGLIQQSSGTVLISNNNIGSITTVSSTTYSHGFESIYVRGVAATLTISNNLIGSLTTANSIHASSTAASALQKQDVYGIYSSGIGTTVISDNTVANLHNAYTGSNSGSRARGIQTIAGSNTIRNNTVRNISSASSQISAASSASVIGISQTANTDGTTQTVTGNTIYDLLNTNTNAFRVQVFGLYYAGPNTGTNTVSGNFIHSLAVSSTDIGATIYGVDMNSGVATCANNIINLGGNTPGYLINGIFDGTTAGNSVNFYFNTVYVGGSVSSGVTSATAAFNNANNTSTRDYRNNILYNARTGGGTGKHYAIVLAGVAGLTIDYNDYFFAGTTLGKIGTLEKTTLALWKTGTGQDANSLSINPGFTIPGGTSAFNYYASAVLPGVFGTGITTDYDGLTRGATPKMGALEVNGYVWQGGVSTDFNTASNWTGGVVPLAGADIIFAAAPNNHCVLDQNRILGKITNAQATYRLAVNGKQLTINDSIKFTNSAKIDATATSSHVVFAGTLAQIIPSGAFVSNTVDGLTVNNSLGLTLNDNFTVSQTLTLTTGALTIGAHTLTLNGAITTTAGTLIGGSSTNIIIGGTGAASLPAVILNNLNVNRSSGINLAGSVSVSGTLALNAGSIAVGANTLTISGSSPTRTSGSLDASNANASLVFANPAAITLPASIFTNSVNNFTLTGIGGITANSNFTIAGILNLQNSNPSVTKGLLDMGTYSLTMGASATTIGAGDVTGIVTRTSFIINTPYSFGNEFTTINMAAGGVLPATMSVKIILSSDHTWKTNAINRYYDIIQTGGNSSTIVTTNLHYLDSELNGATEGNLDLFDYHITSIPPHLDDHGRSNDNIVDNWVGLANMSLTYIAKGTTFDVKYWTLGTSTAANFTWLGAAGSTWGNTANWVGGIVPGTGNHVVIPDATTTPSDPELPATATIGYLLIQAGGILNGGTATILTIDGGYSEVGGSASWDNAGTFNPGTCTVIFTNPLATIADPTNFYNVTVADGAKLSLGTNNIMRIAGALSLSATGILNAALTNNTVEYNGTDQTVIIPNGTTTGYHNLILSGSGMKTMPGTALSVLGDFTISGIATATAGAAITVGGELTIESGSTFITGNYNHTIGKDFDNSGTFTALAGNTITMNGASAQSVYGTATTNFDNLTIDNINGVTLLNNENVTNTLTLYRGNLDVGTVTLGINGTISKTSGFLAVSSESSLSFGGTAAITITSDLFTTPPLISNLTINRSGGVTMGNQNITVNGVLNLPSGTLRLAANTLTIAGSSPTRTSGFIDASNAGATLAFTNPAAIILPALIFSGNVNNLTINGAGGLTASSDFTINGMLNLESENPSNTKGILDMWDGAVMKTLTMGASATTIGIGDVTGIVKRTSFIAGTPYSFGNPFTTITFAPGGTYPTQIQVKITIGTSPSWKAAAINRVYDFVQSGGSNCLATIASHYLDAELNGNNENELVHWTYGTPGPPAGSYEWGRSDFNPADNWVSISNVDIGYFPTGFGQLENTLSKSELASYTWNGSQSTSWTTIENWTNTGTPSAVSNVIIPDASTTINSPTISTLSEIKNLTIESAGKLTIAYNGKLTVNTALLNNAGISGLVIKSTVAGTGSLLQNSASVAATVERFNTNNNKWHFLSSPVTSQTVWPAFAPTPTGSTTLSFGTAPWGWDFYYWNPNADTTSQLYWVNLRKDNAGTYNSGTIDASGNDAGYGSAIPEFAVGRGYLTAYNTGWNPATGSPETHLFTGTLNSGLVEKAIVKGVNSFNLAGNPYPSAIDWKASGWNRNVLVPSGGGYDYWIFNDIIGNYGVCNSNSEVGGTNGTTRYIAPMQGYFVKAISSGTLSMTSTVQVHSSQSWLKENTDVDNLLRLKLTTSANSFSDEMIVVVNSDYSNGGSQKFWSMYTEAPELYAIKDGSTYSIDRMPSVDENSTVAIGIKAGVAASYTLDVTGVTNFFIAKSIILEDLKTGTTRDLKNNPSFTFSANPGDDIERFHLHFGGPFGINHQGSQLEFTIFYINNSVYVSTNSQKSLNGVIYIYNIIGQKIIQKRIVDNISRIDLSAPAGCYIVTIVSNNQTYSKKIFIR